jgi:hypothetical protein
MAHSTNTHPQSVIITASLNNQASSSAKSLSGTPVSSTFTFVLLGELDCAAHELFAGLYISWLERKSVFVETGAMGKMLVELEGMGKP